MPAFYHYLFAFALLSRLSDIVTTWLVSPNLKLEANPLVRKFRWPYAFLTLFAAFLAYYSPPMCVALTVGSFLVAANNASKIPITQILGEEAYFKMTVELAAKGPFWRGLLSRLSPALFFAFLTAYMFFFFPTEYTWGYWIAFGVFIYVLAWLIYGTTSYLRFRKLGKNPATTN